MTTLTQEKLNSIISEAKTAAHQAAKTYFEEKLGNVDQYACGFAWVNIYEVKGNTKLGRMLKAAGISQDHTKAFQIWNPSGFHCQNVDTLEAGAVAAAKVLRDHGFIAYAGSRLD